MSVKEKTLMSGESDRNQYEIKRYASMFLAASANNVAKIGICRCDKYKQNRVCRRKKQVKTLRTDCNRVNDTSI